VAWHNHQLPGPPELINLTPGGQFVGYLQLSLMTGVVFAAPIIFYQLWAFISPGLYRKEKRLVVPFVFFSTALFLSGVAFAYYIAFPFSLNYFFSLLGPISNGGAVLTQRTTFEAYLDFSSRMLLAFGECSSFRFSSRSGHRGNRHAAAAPEVRSLGRAGSVHRRSHHHPGPRGLEPDCRERCTGRALLRVHRRGLRGRQEEEGTVISLGGYTSSDSEARSSMTCERRWPYMNGMKKTPVTAVRTGGTARSNSPGPPRQAS